MSRFDPFRPFNRWQDVDHIKLEVERALAKGAHVQVKTLRQALGRVIADGIMGPIPDREYEVYSGTRMSLHKALQIIRAAHDADLPRVVLTHPDHTVRCDGAENCESPDHRELGEPGPLHHEIPI